MKREMLLLFVLIFCFGIVSATGEKISVVLTAGDQFAAGKEIQLKVNLLDAQNNPIQDRVDLIFENSDKTKRIERSEMSNAILNINLGSNETGGSWSVLAKYGSTESTKTFFSIEFNELARFDISGGSLIITNVGNVPYNKEVQVLIGDAVGVERTGIPIGEKLSYRLIAPDGTYNIKIIVDGKVVLIRSGVQLTGEVIGVLDERLKSNTPITGVRVGEDSDKQLFNSTRNNTPAYIFAATMVAVAIVLAIERRYSRIVKRGY